MIMQALPAHMFSTFNRFQYSGVQVVVDLTKKVFDLFQISTLSRVLTRNQNVPDVYASYNTENIIVIFCTESAIRDHINIIPAVVQLMQLSTLRKMDLDLTYE